MIITRYAIGVRHDGSLKMVGKAIAFTDADGQQRTALYHEATASQYHVKLDSPGGIDLAVIDHLEKNAIDQVHHYDKHSGVLLAAPVARFLAIDTPVQVSGGRARVYLPTAQWRRLPSRPYALPPWTQTVVEVESVGPAPIRRPVVAPTPPPVEQGRLWADG
jgi:hypothetical protein